MPLCNVYKVKQWLLKKSMVIVNQAMTKFKTTPLVITEEAKRSAKEALCPPSARRTGEEDDILSNRSYLSLQGQIEKVSDFKSIIEYLEYLGN